MFLYDILSIGGGCNVAVTGRIISGVFGFG